MVFLLSVLALPAGRPDVQRARRDFLSDNPTYMIERVILEKVEFSEMTFRVVYYTPIDTQFHVELRQYVDAGGQWSLSQITLLN